MWDPKLSYSLPIGIGEVDGINAKTAHPNEAAAFLNWFVGDPKRAASWADKLISTWVPPVRVNPSDYPSTMDPRFKAVQLAMVAAESNGTAGYVAWTSWAARTDSYMWGNMEQMLSGGMSIMTYLKGAEQQFLQDKAQGKIPFIPRPAGL
jgi:raffinose/stachyose/melibiose transport system substrate-binding protein